MNFERTIFSQVMDFVLRYEFNKCVDRYHGTYKTKSFSCWDQFLCMAFAQLLLRCLNSCISSISDIWVFEITFNMMKPVLKSFHK